LEMPNYAIRVIVQLVARCALGAWNSYGHLVGISTGFQKRGLFNRAARFGIFWAQGSTPFWPRCNINLAISRLEKPPLGATLFKGKGVAGYTDNRHRLRGPKSPHSAGKGVARALTTKANVWS